MTSERNGETPHWTVRWGEHSRTCCATGQDVVRQVEQLWAKYGDDEARLVEIQFGSGPCLTIVVGRNESVLNYIVPDFDLSYISVGRESVGGFVYVDWGMETEVDRRHVVDTASALRALQQFVDREGEQPDCLEWEPA